MFSEFIRDYFSFTQKERTGMIVLLVVTGGLFVLPCFFTAPSVKADPKAFASFKNELDGLKKEDPVEKPEKYEGREKTYQKTELGVQSFSMPVSLFDFDPNKIDRESWQRLGLRDKTIHTILNYRAKGGVFRRADDLQKVYGITECDFLRLLPFIRIESEKKPLEFSLKKSYKQGFEKDSFAGNYPKSSKDKLVKIDINKADSTDFTRLRGIGIKLAARIIHFRERLGGFYAIGQVGETYALPDSVFQQIKGQLVVGELSLQQMDLNSVAVEQLKQHPYVRWNLANAIVQYRKQHGAFSKVEDLLNLPMVDSALLKKVEPYFAVKAATY